MRAWLRVDPAAAAPLWRQIEEGVRQRVAAQTLLAGAPVPSVRELARDLGVNPNTVVKAYQRLVEAGVLVVRRGEGTYVAEMPPTVQAAAREQVLREGARQFASAALGVGATEQGAVRALGAAWQDLSTSGRGE